MPAARFAGEFRAQRFQPDAYPRWLNETDLTPACRGADPEIFFPENRHATAIEARDYCRRCPLKTTCQEWALEQPVADLHGIWGGLSQKQREAIRAQRRADHQRAQEAA